MTTEGDAMPVVLEKARINLWNLIGFAIGIAVTAFGWGIIYADMQSTNREMRTQISNVERVVNSETQARRDRGLSTDANFKEIREQLPAIGIQATQITRLTEIAAENRKAIEETNRRMDRIVESFGGKLDTVIERVGQVAADVRVLGTRLDERPQRTSMEN